jgi:multidrug efflux pump subunit AcrA (membrane-fusion protein)
VRGMRCRYQGFLISLLLLVGMALGGAQADQARQPPQSGLILLNRCVLEYKRTSLLGANQSGVLEKCFVAPGDRVESGQILGHLYDGELRAELQMRAWKAASDIPIRLARAKHKLALSRLAITHKLMERDYSSKEELNIQTQDEEVGRLSVEEACHQRALAELERGQTEATIRSMEIKSPHDGIVVEVLKVPGQSIAISDPIVRVIDPSTIRATGYLDVSDAWRVRPGQAVRIWADISGADLDIEKEAFAGRVEYVDLQVSPESRTVKLTAIVANRNDRLRSGLEARMEIIYSTEEVDQAKPPR